MGSIEGLYSLTLELKSILDDKNIDRDLQIEKINTFLEARGNLIETIDPNSLSSCGKEKIREILIMSANIEKQMDEIKENISKDILHSKKGKMAYRGYNQIYSLPSFDGHYFDRKK